MFRRSRRLRTRRCDARAAGWRRAASSPSPAWKLLCQAQLRHAPAGTGPYAHLRHPQYIAFIVIMLGVLLQWPTILTLAMFPVLVAMYVDLAHTEEAEARRMFGAEHARYAAQVPSWFPAVRRSAAAAAAIAASLASAPGAPARAQTWSTHMGGGFGMGGMMWGAGVLWLLLILLAVLGVIALVKYISRS